ncbi:TPA: excisionase [Yersinia enterocolitica]|nr:excisionase [Yersinia enterocolitica]EKN5920673.1 excisionase [Yersinia enterocolitica]EKN5985161.1 excisionase [Yersinia enterocolitica]EKN5988388.1 excisionase [Yersinia enterocolitica]ELX2243276.1 excisionase [Yersinia enterocolitica]
MTKLLTLEEWAEETYRSKQPTSQTLQRWARGGNIYPAPEKHGREYRVRPDAIYIQPKSYRLAKEILKTSPSTSSSLIERIIHGKEAKKV